MTAPRAILLLALLFVPVSVPAAKVLVRGGGAGAAPGAPSAPAVKSASSAIATLSPSAATHSPAVAVLHGSNSMAPPAASTGGFGEDSCAFCHIDYTVNEEGGTLELLGLPEAGYRPGESLRLEVRLHHAELERAGFQLTSRFAAGDAEGEQAGTLEAGDGQQLQTPSYTPIAYLGHALGGIEPTGEGERRWHFTWTAPDAAAAAPGPVVFHVAANAADGDGMEWGDRVYTLEVKLPAR